MSEKKYRYFDNEQGDFTIVHRNSSEDDETYIAITDDGEKAYFIVSACNAMAGIDDPAKFVEEHRKMREVLEGLRDSVRAMITEDQDGSDRLEDAMNDANELLNKQQ